jgi:hypothetical protein
MLFARAHTIIDRIANDTHELLDLLTVSLTTEGDSPDNHVRRMTYAQLARELILERRTREAVLPKELLGDAAWDMLLDLFVASEERKRIFVSSLCIASFVPPTTALRWIGVLVERKLVERSFDKDDRRRSYVSLTPDAQNRLEAHLTQLASRRGVAVSR